MCKMKKIVVAQGKEVSVTVTGGTVKGVVTAQAGFFVSNVSKNAPVKDIYFFLPGFPK